VKNLENVNYTGRKVMVNGVAFFPVVDIIADLVGSKDPTQYWTAMQAREKIELSTICRQFYVPHQRTGREYKMDCVNLEGLFRLVQSIPSPKVEPFKRVMARLAAERVQEHLDPELGIKRARERAIKTYRSRGMSETWIKARLDGIDERNDLTDLLKKSGFTEPSEYARFTQDTHHAAFGITPKGHKEIKQLKKTEKLRDNMVALELSVAKFSEALLTDFLNDGAPVEEAKEKHRVLISKLRTNIEEVSGKSIATPVTPKKLLSKKK